MITFPPSFYTYFPPPLFLKGEFLAIKNSLFLDKECTSIIDATFEMLNLDTYFNNFILNFSFKIYPP